MFLSMASSSATKKTKGRQKIQMKKIENEDDRLITFSKRRSGIYKKASELVTLCGVEIAFIVFSPAGKAFSFGHPSVESIVNRFLNQNPPPNDNTHPLVEAHRKFRIDQLTQQYNELVARLEAERERGKMLEQLMSKGKRKENQGWWEVSTDQLELEELKKLLSCYGRLYGKLIAKINQKTADANALLATPPLNLPPQILNPFPGHGNDQENVSGNFTPAFIHGGGH